ncbi:hypothetical protein [Haloplanus aerogenes]|uniref:Copper resistance protein D domain-containing protein n=1 Tax=Haloplanus aerogenes TaxID=660522 RepID=A0A3M0CVA8_9EURY|nr:hypothetical protein [Haloplanus aerogenes]AZH23955.1 hypothetical protein DU502_00550 [Haloplanus aerogenes]RMB13281.1 hypothetical protein ATH50_2614 [Haloplanus aerogenes]
MVPVLPVPLATATHLFVRWLHVLAMAVALGGGVLAWGVSYAADAETTLTVATTYEVAFWGALGVLVMTGVGNLGALAPAIPRGRWGAAFVVKLGLLLVVLIGSAVRTTTVRAASDAATPATTTLERGYALTTLALITLVALAAVMAHG